MAFRFTGRQAFFAVVIILFLVVVSALLVKQPSSKPFGSNPSNQNTQTPVGNGGTTAGAQTPSNQTGNGTVGTNGTRFVDTITKIAPGYNRNDIQKSLEQYSFSPIIFEIDDPKNADSILLSLSKDEFQLRKVAPTISAIAGNATQNAILKLENNPHVTNIYYESRGGSLLQDSGPLINATLVWNLQLTAINITGQNVTVCIVDTGVNYTHPDLGGCPRTSNITSANCSKVIGGTDTVGSGDADPMDEDPEKHGTHVAGIVAANGGIRGIANGAKLVAVRAWPDASSGAALDMALGIQWCIDHRNDFSPPIKIVSFSGSPNGNNLYNSTCDTVDVVVKAANNATFAGLLMVVAAGNNGSNTSMTSPACGSNVTSVGYTDKSDAMGVFTNRNNLTALLAPGAYINSTNGSNGKYVEAIGTSSAAPHVSGAAALLLQFKPDLTPTQIIQVLNITGKQLNDTNDASHPNATNLTFSRIDVYRAISAVNDSLLRVNTLSVINVSSLSRSFEFTIQNANLSNITNISWSADFGDGTTVNSNTNISALKLRETVLGRLVHNYSRPGLYIVNVSARSGNLFHSRNITVYVGDLIITNFSTINASGLQRTFQFTVRNDLRVNLSAVHWNVTLGDGTSVADNQVTTLNSKEEVFVRLRYNYSGIGTYIVNASATNNTLIDSRNITISVT